MSLWLGVDDREDGEGTVFAVGIVLFLLSMAGACWAAWSYWQSTRDTTYTVTRETSADSMTTDSLATNRSSFRPRKTAWTGSSGVEKSILPAGASSRYTSSVAVAPLSWNELNLMVRAGYSDEEVIRATVGKQITAPLTPAREQNLRGAGAGEALIRHLHDQPIYEPLGPELAHQTIAANSIVAPPAGVPLSTGPAVSVVDYAARDREIARLKKAIDEMDEDMRMARINPAKYRYWYKFQWRGNRVDQTSYDAYLKSLDEARNELRREKWRLEGR